MTTASAHAQEIDSRGITLKRFDARILRRLSVPEGGNMTHRSYQRITGADTLVICVHGIQGSPSQFAWPTAQLPGHVPAFARTRRVCAGIRRGGQRRLAGLHPQNDRFRRRTLSQYVFGRGKADDSANYAVFDRQRIKYLLFCIFCIIIETNPSARTFYRR